MKKKLSLLIASLMVLTLVPLNAFAVKTDFNTKETVKADDKVNVSATLEVQLSDTVDTSTGSVVKVYLNDGGEFVDKNGNVDTNGNNVLKAFNVRIYDDLGAPGPDLSSTINPVGNKYFTVDLKGNTLTTGYKLLINGKVDLDGADKGDHKWTIDASEIGLGKYEKVFATVAEDEGKFSKTVEKKKVVGRGEGRLSAIEITVDTAKEDTIEITLPAGEFTWDLGNTNVNGGTPAVVGTDNNVLRITGIPTGTKTVIVKPAIDSKKDASVGDIEVDISKGKWDAGKKEITDPKTDSLVVGEFKDYGVVLETDKDVKSVLANGDKYSVDVTLKSVDKTNLDRLYDFDVEGGDVWITTVKNGTLVDGGTQADPVDNFYIKGIDDNEVTFTVNVVPDRDTNGDIVLKAKSRGGEPVECTVLKVKPVLTMTVEPKEILSGERVVEVNDVVLTETEGRALKPGVKYGITLTNMKFDDAKFENKGAVEAEGIRVKDLSLDKFDQTIYFTVTGRSAKDKPAKIVIKDLKVVTTRSLPLGEYELVAVEVDKAKATKDHKLVAKIKSDKYELFKIESKPFFKAVSELGRVKKTTVFTLGSADYTVDGVAMKLDAPVFTQDNYTMLPVRAIADALGVEVVWNQENKTATFIDGDKVVSVTVNAKVLYKNGIAYPMATKSSVKNERMFISIASVGDAFGLNRNTDYTYDDATKTVTIYPQAKAE